MRLATLFLCNLYSYIEPVALQVLRLLMAVLMRSFYQGGCTGLVTILTIVLEFDF